MIPRLLPFWFVVHFVADVAFAIPLFLAPEWFLGLVGWETVDPIATRLVAAALFGIGIESLFARNSDVNGFKGMPPKGGRGDLSDDTIKAVVKYMVKESK